MEAIARARTIGMLPTGRGALPRALPALRSAAQLNLSRRLSAAPNSSPKGAFSSKTLKGNRYVPPPPKNSNAVRVISEETAPAAWQDRAKSTVTQGAAQLIPSFVLGFGLMLGMTISMVLVRMVFGDPAHDVPEPRRAEGEEPRELARVDRR